jgi:ATP-dependent DNA helicase RecG
MGYRGIIPSVRLEKKNGKEIIIIEVEHSNYPRNELLADVFFKAGLIEAWGRGTRKITYECKKAGLTEPEFKEELGGFAVYFYKDIYTEDNLRKMGLNER